MKKIGLLATGIFISSNVFAYTMDAENHLPSFFSDEVREEWLKKQDDKKNNRRDRLQEIRLQRLQRQAQKNMIVDPDEIFEQEEERRRLQEIRDAEEEANRKKFFEKQQQDIEERAQKSIWEIRGFIQQLEKLERELKSKLEGDLERISVRKDFLTAKLTELEEGDFSSGVVVMNVDDAIDLENKFLENIMISPTETPLEMEPLEEIRPTSETYRSKRREFYRRTYIGRQSGRLSTLEKLKQMRTLATRENYSSDNMTRAQKVQRALETRARRRLEEKN